MDGIVIHHILLNNYVFRNLVASQSSLFNSGRIQILANGTLSWFYILHRFDGGGGGTSDGKGDGG